jgi:hypothetical protein
MGYSTVCNAEEAGKLKGTGRSGKAQAGAEQELFWSPNAFSFASASAAVDQLNWDAAVAAGNLYYIGVIEEFDASDSEATFYESANGNLRLKTAEAKRIRQYRLVECSCTHAALLSFDGNNGRLFMRTSRGYLKARMDGVTVQGFKTNQFDVGLLTAATTDSPSFTPIDVTFATPIDDDKDVFEDKIDFEFSQVDQVFNAELSASGVSSNGTALTFTLRVEKDCSGVALTGITEVMLAVTDVNGNALVKTVTPNGSNYDVSVTTALTGVEVSIDAIQLVGGILYASDVINVAV